MKLSLKWLCDHVDAGEFFDKPEILSDKLTDVGLEVEDVIRGAEGLEHVVVGKITKLGKHPDADKLTYCDLDVGGGETLNIVCGAKNHKEGDKVVVAKVGAILPGDFKIKKSKIRGVESFGMLCSNAELGLAKEGEKSEGILILDKDAEVGQDFAKHAGLDDVIFEINVTPNRADCLSHLGLAREVSSLFKLPLKARKSLDESRTKKDVDFTLELLNSKQCPRYMGRAVYGVKVQESPEWLKSRLESVGMNSINNVVDITNFIMLDSGQPLHAFDLDKIKGNKLIISDSKKDESFTTLDGTELKLTGEELTIRNPEGPVALAGVIGGKNSGVDENTKNIFIEAAHFVPSSVRRTSRRFGIETDSCYRFSRGTDESRVHDCLNEALSLALDIAGGELGERTFEEYPDKKEASKISVSKSYLDDRLGFSVDSKRIEEIFKELSFKIISSSSTEWTISPPGYRWDIEIKEDLVEEIGRIVGYSSIPEILPEVKSSPQNDVKSFTLNKKLKEQMIALGFNEAIHYNFYHSKDEAVLGNEILNWLKSGESINISNPLSEDLAVMRTSLVPQLFSNYVRNFKLGNKVSKVFESGQSHVFVNNEFKESGVLSAGIWNDDKNKAPQDLLSDLMGVLESLMSSWKVGQWRAESIVKDALLPSLMHPSLAARIISEGKEIGFISAIHPAKTEGLKVSNNFAFFEIDLNKFFNGKPRPIKYKAFSRHPIVERDFSVTVKKLHSMDEVVKKIKKASGKLFVSYALKDKYSGKGIAEDEVSLTLSVKFQAEDRTLAEEELKALQKKVLDSLSGL